MKKRNCKFRLKLWKKMFLIIFTCVAILLNVAFYTIMNMSYEQQLNHEKARAVGEQTFIFGKSISFEGKKGIGYSNWKAECVGKRNKSYTTSIYFESVKETI